MRHFLIVIAMVSCALAGCEKPEEVEQYKVPKPDVLLKDYYGETAVPKSDETRTPSDRMLAAIVPHGSQLWFFKLVGPDGAVVGEGANFAMLVASIHFTDGADSHPEWKLPDGWQESPGTAGRFATLKIGGGDKPLELTVNMLAKPDADATQFILMNVNRWRGQMGLKSIDEKRLASDTKQIEIGGEPAYFVTLSGRFQAGGMGRPPFASSGMPDLPSGHPPIGPGDAPPTVENPAVAGPNSAPPLGDDLKFEVPAGWQAGETNATRRAAFVVHDGSKTVEITAIPLPSRAANLSANVNRWRGQLQLPPIDEQQIAAAVKQLAVGDATGNYVEIVGPADSNPRETILAVLAERGDQVWFFKLKGDSQLAEREKPHFEAFVKSVKFGPTETKYPNQ